MNTIWDIQNAAGDRVKSFQEISQMGRAHFQSLFKDPESVNIAEILKICLSFSKVYGRKSI